MDVFVAIKGEEALARLMGVTPRSSDIAFKRSRQNKGEESRKPSGRMAELADELVDMLRNKWMSPMQIRQSLFITRHEWDRLRSYCVKQKMVITKGKRRDAMIKAAPLPQKE